MAATHDNNIQSHVFQPIFWSAIPPAKTVIKEKSHSPKAPAAPPAWRSLRGAIYTHRCQLIESPHVSRRLEAR